MINRFCCHKITSIEIAVQIIKEIIATNYRLHKKKIKNYVFYLPSWHIIHL
ncbi:hypothetical protein XCR1_830011 [Xenorhabdus cabanillasii JM26]|uniref:Uncharacterized protein n=1 Tax=Xenorhabdus cabanillasii JM26 TaxID=1427517 RepID=W1JAX9_9GAMM|nr:hypothetical protein XCR1_830011 [Xenorhabdus cabanillasii JM26]